jgi:hypothetical protein
MRADGDDAPGDLQRRDGLTEEDHAEHQRRDRLEVERHVDAADSRGSTKNSELIAMQ